MISAADLPLDTPPRVTNTTTEDVASSRSTASSPEQGATSHRDVPPLSLSAYPDKIIKVDYAVRGAVAIRADAIASGCLSDKPFDKILQCNIGNPQAVGLKPLTYVRETLALMSCPSLLEKSDEELEVHFKRDNIKRARLYADSMQSVGAYTHSQGNIELRRSCATFFERRDGIRPSECRIFLCNGASEGITTLLTCCVAGRGEGVMLPLPQYPLYAATMTRLDGTTVFYDLDESKGWSFDDSTLQRAYTKAVADGIDVRVLVVINPGNPCPTFLEREQIKSILKFAEERHILVMADEVYQENLYTEKKFTSFRSVLLEEGFKTQLASVHSASKGFYGECGMRGGVCLLDNVDDDAFAVIYKMRSVDLCSNTFGQIAMATIVSPPQPGDESYDLYLQEKTSILLEMGQKAKIVCDFMNSLEGVSCVPISAGMYVFPSMTFSKKAEKDAESKGLSVELMYCLELLEATGIATTPGEGFGQQEGTHHVRVTILPALEDLKKALALYKDFHDAFMKRYAE
eukprot:Protomagalhaensia_wolfi_Nauph_80__5672@NODE_664_length_2152_cov_160_311879_g494_i0_p1_GENE_NODE_664_length_2152_cov_160_311879_g494_i0NODE_664_length_2152_cov_160_311879_g494_i0_p1_ORF_typecomplete_len517_score100_48Aminotran_1_2/PF00155_21/1_3e61DegT_DnrJ_EryC1/PF01041_17/0_00014_NODE_664_length_2152_cov_160_311879_g494_i05472097